MMDAWNNFQPFIGRSIEDEFTIPHRSYIIRVFCRRCEGGRPEGTPSRAIRKEERAEKEEGLAERSALVRVLVCDFFPFFSLSGWPANESK